MKIAFVIALFGLLAPAWAQTATPARAGARPPDNQAVLPSAPVNQRERGPFEGYEHHGRNAGEQQQEVQQQIRDRSEEVRSSREQQEQSALTAQAVADERNEYLRAKAREDASLSRPREPFYVSDVIHRIHHEAVRALDTARNLTRRDAATTAVSTILKDDAESGRQSGSLIKEATNRLIGAVSARFTKALAQRAEDLLSSDAELSPAERADRELERAIKPWSLENIGLGLKRYMDKVQSTFKDYFWKGPEAVISNGDRQ